MNFNVRSLNMLMTFLVNNQYILIYAKSYYEVQKFRNSYVYTSIAEMVEQYRNNDISWKYTTILIVQGKKEYKSKRKQIQEKLIKFATRVPVFMYFTDYRERCLKDVITQLEPGLFRKVTGLDVKDFDLLVSLDVFNSSLMNDAVYKFKRYEDASLSYVGIDKHEGQDIGLYDTAITNKEFKGR